MKKASCSLSVGSSPHTRDKLKTLCVFSHPLGIIPAYAGQIIFFIYLCFNYWDHPRIRGTNGRCGRVHCRLQGSSPHTRDKSGLLPANSSIAGIIPAYAGQIRFSLWEIMFLQDHPRIRGTNLSYNTCTGFRAGSSPHTRDKFFPSNIHRGIGGIIPAYAGQIKVVLE